MRALHRRLERELGTVDLVITNNRKRMVSARRNGDRCELRVHRMFVDAPAETVDALIGLARGRAASRDALRRFIAKNQDAIDHEVSQSAVRVKGEHHDLTEALQRAIELVDDHNVGDLAITWGRDGRGRRSIRFGSFDFRQRLIRIHPALDESWVPAYFVDFVVYHELLHLAVPPVVDPQTGRRDLHPPEFREREARFPDYDRAQTWQRDNLARLLDR